MHEHHPAAVLIRQELPRLAGEESFIQTLAAFLATRGAPDETSTLLNHLESVACRRGYDVTLDESGRFEIPRFEGSFEHAYRTLLTEVAGVAGYLQRALVADQETSFISTESDHAGAHYAWRAGALAGCMRVAISMLRQNEGAEA